MDPLLQKNLITTKSASEISGYTSDYLSRLIRSGKISGKKIGHSWLIDSDSLSAFIEAQKHQNLNRARELASARAKEYKQQQKLTVRIKRDLTKAISLPEDIIAPVPFASHAFALSVACAVVLGGAALAQAAVSQEFAEKGVALAMNAVAGFKDTYGVIPASISENYAQVKEAMTTRPVAVAARTLRSTAAIALPSFSQPDLSALAMRMDCAGTACTHAARAIAQTVPAHQTAVSINVQPIATELSAMAKSPAYARAEVMRGYLAIGMTAYAGIDSAFALYRDAIESAGQGAYGLALATRDNLRTTPHLLASAAQAYVGLTHAAIGADVSGAYLVANAAPASARATVLALGTVGDTLAHATAQIPGTAAGVYLGLASVTAHAAPALAEAVFGAEYHGALKFVALTDSLRSGYLTTITTTGALAYEGATKAHTASTRAIATAATSGLGGVYHGVTASVASAADAAAKIPLLAAAASAVQPPLSAGAGLALSTYQAINHWFSSVGDTLATIFSPIPTTVAPTSPVRPSRTVAVATTTGTTPVVTRTVISNPIYTTTTVVEGVSQAKLDTSLLALKNDVLGTVAGMIRPVATQAATNETTIQYVNMIQDLTGLIVRNGDFRNSTFTGGNVNSAVSVSAASGNFTNLTGGYTTLGTTTMTGNVAITNIGTLSIGSTTPWAQVSINPTSANGSAPAFAIGSSTGTSLVVTNAGNVGIGTASPQASLDVQGSTGITLRTNANSQGFTIMDRPTVPGDQLIFQGNAGNYSLFNVNTKNAGMNGNAEKLGGIALWSVDSATTSNATQFQLQNNPTYGAVAFTQAFGTGANRPLSLQSVWDQGSTPTQLVLATSGNVGIGSTSPWGLLSVNPNGVVGPAFVVGSSTATNLIVANSGNVGIGKSAPGAPLDVKSVGTTTNSGIRLENQADGNIAATLYELSSGIGAIELRRNGFQGTRIVGDGSSYIGTPSGNALLGMNTTTPDAEIAISGDLNKDVLLSLHPANAQTNNLINIYNTSNTLTSVLTAAGSLGIGTTSPTQALAVNGSVVTTGSYYLASPGSANARIWYDGVLKLDNGTSGIVRTLGQFQIDNNLFLNNGNLYGPTSSGLNFYASNGATQANTIFSSNNTTERMRITSGGNVGIGTTSPAQMLSVAGNGYLTGGLGVGVATTTPGVLQTSGDALIGGNLFVNGNSTVIGQSTTNSLVINSSIKSSIIPNQNITYDLGSPSFYWRNAYVGNLIANNISAASTTISGTQSATFTLNSDNVSADNEDMSLVFFRGSVQPNAILSWNSATTSKRFEFNHPLYISDASASTTETTFTLQSAAGQTANIFNIASSSGTNLFSFTADGKLGIGTTSPTYGFTVAVPGNTLNAGITQVAASTGYSLMRALNTGGNAVFGAADFTGVSALVNGLPYATVVGSNNNTALQLMTNGVARVTVDTSGNVGIGTTSPVNGKLVVQQASDSVTKGIQILNSTALGALYLWVDGSNTAHLDSPSNGSSPIVLNGSGTGNVGIGTTTPASKLTVYDNSASGTTVGMLIRNDGASGTYPYGSIYQAGSSFPIALYKNAFVVEGQANGGLDLGANSGPLIFNLSRVEKMRIDNTTGNVGIGTTSPFAQLSVNGAAGGTTPLFAVSSSTAGFATTTVAEIDANGNALFGLGGGNVGIGTTSPIAKFAISGQTTDKLFTVYDGVYNTNLGFGSAGIGASRIDLYQNSYVGTLNAKSAAGTAAAWAFQVEGSEKMRIANNGNVGIGTTSPTGMLDIEGAGNSKFLNLTTTSAGTGYVYSDWSNTGGTLRMGIERSTAAALFANTINYAAAIGTMAGTPLQFGTNASIRMTIDSSGNVGIGTTTPGYKLDIQGGSLNIGGKQLSLGGVVRVDDNLSSSYTAIYPQGGLLAFLSGGKLSTYDSSNSFALSLFTNSTSANIQVPNVGGGYIPLNIATGGSTRVTVDTSGNVGIGTTSPAAKLDVYGVSGVTENVVNTFGSAVIRGTNMAIASTTKGILDLEMSGTIGGQDLGPTLTFSNNFWQFGKSYTRVGGAIKSGKENATNQFTHSYLSFFTNNGTDLAEQMRITSAGNVGIGTTTPSAQVDITKTLRVLSGTQVPPTTGKGMELFYTTGTDQGIIQAYDRDASAYKPLTFKGSTFTLAGTGGSLFVSTAGNVGIGTTSPFAQLSIAGASNGTTPLFAISSSTASATTTVAEIDQNGNAFLGMNGSYIGIGTTTQLSSGLVNLAVPTTSAVGLMITTGGSGGVSSSLGTNNLNFASNYGTINGGGLNASSGNITLKSGSNDIIFAPGLVEKARLSLAGNLGIGSSSPFAMLSVNGAAGGTTPLFAVSSSTAGFATTTVAEIDQNGNALFGLGGGYVGIGTASPAARLHVSGGNILLDNTYGLQIKDDTGVARRVVEVQANGAAYYYGYHGAMAMNAVNGANYLYPSTGGSNAIAAIGTNGVTINPAGASIPNSGVSLAVMGGSVGIGTTSPFAQFAIGGVSNGTTNLFAISTSTASATTTALTIDNNGNLSLLNGANLTVSGNLTVTGSQTITGPTTYTGLVQMNGGASTTQLTTTGSTYLATAGGNVGIGTTSPYAPFSVTAGTGSLAFQNVSQNNLLVSGINATVVVNSVGSAFPGFVVKNQGAIIGQMSVAPSGTDSSFYTPGNQLFLAGGNTERMRISTTGNVGIGTTSPYAQLSIATPNGATGSQQTLFAIASSTQAGATTTLMTVLASGNVGIGTTSPARILSVGDDGLYSAYFSGRVGLGVQTPGSALDVSGTANVRGALQSQNGTSVFGRFGTDSSGSFISSDTQGKVLTIYTTPVGGTITTRMLIDSTGNVGIGTTSPIAKLDVLNTLGGSTPLFSVASSTNGAGTTTALYVASNGNVGFGMTNPLGAIDTGTGQVRVGSLVQNGGSTGSLNYRGMITSDGEDTANPVFRGYRNGGAVSADLLQLYTDNLTTPALFVKGTGNVGIGTSTVSSVLTIDSPVSSSPLSILAGANDYFQFKMDATGSSNAGISYIETGTHNGTQFYLQDADNLAGRLTFDFRSNNGTNKLLAGDSAGNIGIGTTTPNTRLEIYSNSANGSIYELASLDGGTLSPTASGSGVIQSFRAGSGSYMGAVGGYGNGTATGVGLWSGTISGAPGLFMTGGNVGIGTANPGALLAVGTSTSVYTNATIMPQSPAVITNGSILTTNYLRDGTQLYIGGGAIEGSDGSHSYTFAGMGIGHNTISSTDTSSFLTFNTAFDNTFSERMRIDRAGNVGIGTTTPTTKLQVDKSGQLIGQTTPNGAMVISNVSNGNAALELGVDNTSLGYIQSRNLNSNTTYNLLLNPSGGNVGIGTTTPSEKLTVSGSGHTWVRAETTGTSNAAGFYTNTPGYGVGLEAWSAGGYSTTRFGTTTPGWNILEADNGNGLMVGSVNSAPLVLGTNNAERMRIDQNGKVGIGTTSPTELLSIQGTAGTLGVGYVGTGMNRMLVGAEIQGDTTAAANVGFIGYGPTVGGGPARSIAMGAYTGTAWNEIMRLQAGGNVGIGTTSPAAQLDVVTNNAARDALRLNYTGGAGGGIWGFTPYIAGVMNDGLAIIDRTTGAANTRMVIDQNGNVGFGTTSPQVRLDLFGNASGYVHSKIVNTNLSAGGELFTMAETDDGTTPFYIERWNSGNSSFPNQTTIANTGNLLFRVNAAERMRIGTNGNVGIGTSSPSSRLEVSTTGADNTLTLTAGTSNDNRINFYSGPTLKYQLYVGATLGDLQFVPNGGAASITFKNGGNVGIGTTSPMAKLNVAGGSASANIALTDTDSNTDSKSWAIQSLNSGGNAQLRFRAVNDAFSNGLNSLVITRSGISSVTSYFENGNVGIGTTSPTATLGLQGSIGVNSNQIYLLSNGLVDIGTTTMNNAALNVGGAIMTPNGAGGYRALDNTGVGVTLLGISTANNVSYQGSTVSGSMQFSIPNSTGGFQWYAGSTPTQVMQLTNGGNLGIGSTSPYAQLSISNSATTPANGTLFTIASTTGGISTSTLMTVLANGNVGIGKSNPTTPLDVIGNISSSQSVIAQNATLSTRGSFGDVYQASGVSLSYWNGSSVIPGLIVNNLGNVGIGTSTPWGQLSVNPNGVTGPAFVVGSSTATNFIVTNAGNVGIGTNSPSRLLQISSNSSTAAPPEFVIVDTFGNSNEHATGISASGNAFRIRLLGDNVISAGDSIMTTARSGSTLSSIVLAPTNGLVGIGTTSPTLPLSVKALAGNSAYFAGNVGIGTNNPGSKLEVNGDIKITSGSGGKLVFADGTTLSTNSVTGSAGLTSWGDINMQTGGQIAFQTGNGTATSTKMVVTNAGNVGIGQASPSYLLDLGTATGDKLAVYGNGAGTTYGFGYQTNRLYVSANGTEVANFSNGGNMGLGTTSPYAQLSISNNLNTAANTPLFAIASTTGGTSTTTLMTVLANGNVGIGTATPAALLHVAGSFSASNSTAGGIKVSNTNSAGYSAVTWLNDSGKVTQMTVSGTTFSNGIFNADAASFNTNGTGGMNLVAYDAGGVIRFATGGLATSNERMRIDSNGNIGMGTTSPYAQLSIANNLNTPANTPLFAIASTTGGTSTSTLMTVLANGNVGIGTTTYPGLLNVDGQIFGGNINNQTAPTYSFFGFPGVGMTVNQQGSFLFVSGGAYRMAFDGSGLILNNGQIRAGSGNKYFSMTDVTSAVNQLNFSNSVTSSNPVLGVAGSDSNISISITPKGSGNTIFTNGNVGIGTTSPYAQLSISNSATTAANGTLFAIASTTGGISTSTLMTVLANGNVGIGVANPLYTLDINGRIYSHGNTITSDSQIVSPNFGTMSYQASNTSIDSYTGYNLLLQTRGGGSSVGIGSTTPWGQLSVNPNGVSGPAFVIGSSTATLFTVASSGNFVGIGTANPLYTLHVVGNTYRTGNDYLNDTAVISWGNGTSKMSGGNTTGIVFNGTGGSETMRLLPNNNVGIGSTTPGTLLSIGGNGTGINFVDGTTATSTISGNLYVKGTLRAAVSYVGDLVFSNNFRFVEGDAAAPLQTLNLNNQFGSTTLTIADNGNVGIGTTTPNHTLTVAGDVGAIAFVNTSTRDAKTDISYVDASSTDDMLTELKQLKVATYRYKIEDQNDPLRLGFIAEDAAQIAPEILSPDGKGVDIYKFATFTLAGVQALAAKVDGIDARVTALEARMNALDSGAISSASGSPVTFSTTSLASALNSFGVLIQKGIAQFNTLVFRQLVASKDADGTSSAGSVTILTGNTVAQVNNSLVLPSTKVFVTFNSPITGSWWVSDKTNGSFRVVLSAPQTGDVSFDYFLVQTEGQIATSTPQGPVGSGVSQSNGPDTVPPTITLLGDNPVHVSVGGVFTEPGVTVADNADGTDPYVTFINGMQQAVNSSTIDTSSPTTYVITYKATDAAGNSSTAMRSVIVGNPDGTVSVSGSTATTTAASTTASADTTAPVVTLNGSAALQLTVGDTFTDPGATALDNVDGDLTSHIKVSGTVTTTAAGTYTLTYSATDAAGNTGSASRLVTVVAASTASTTTSSTSSTTTSTTSTAPSTATSTTTAPSTTP